MRALPRASSEQYLSSRTGAGVGIRTVFQVAAVEEKRVAACGLGCCVEPPFVSSLILRAARENARENVRAGIGFGMPWLAHWWAANHSVLRMSRS
jgi:hypothetical protein